MEIGVFNLRDDERPLLEKWKKENPQVKIRAYGDNLSLDKIDLARGCDSVCLQTISEVGGDLCKGLKELGINVISQRSAGFDMYNLDDLNDYGMTLINVPRYSPYAIGEYVLASALYFSRNLNRIYGNSKRHDFSWTPSILSKEMRTLTVGIVGTGNIGRITGKLFKDMGAKILGYDIYESNEAKGLLEYVSLDYLYENSDIISFHVPLTDENYHMVNKGAIEKMKDGVIIINAARGKILDTRALLDGLESGKIKGCALDVYEREYGIVKKDLSGKNLGDDLLEELIKREDVVFTPHIAFYTETALENLISFALDESIKFIETGKSDSVVNG